MTTRVSNRLFVALLALIVSHVALSLAALLRSGEWNWFGDAGRPIIIGLLAWLVTQGRSWARWVLIAWVSLSALAFLGGMFTSGAIGFGLGAVLFAVMAGVYVWVIIELVMADIAGPTTKTV